jgi:hypothetical protein
MIIGVSGKAGSGKDTVADHLVKEYGFVKVALADPMKRFCMEAFDFTEEQLWGKSENRNAPDMRYPWDSTREVDGWGHSYLTPRYALQQLGTEWGRNCYPDVWVDHALRVAKKILTPFEPNHKIVKEGWYCYTQVEGFNNTFDIKEPGGVVISDIRFNNELAAIKKVGRVVQVVRAGAGLEGAAGTHRSEAEQDGFADDDFDHIIVNQTTVKSLLMKVDQMMAVFSGRIVPYDEEKKDIPPFKR